MTISAFDEILANAAAKLEAAGELTFSQLVEILEELGIREAQLDGTLEFLAAIPGVLEIEASPETLYRWEVREPAEAIARDDLSGDPGRTWNPENPCFYCGSQITAGRCENESCPDPLRFAASEFVAPGGITIPEVESAGVEFRRGVRLESIQTGRGDELERLWKNAESAIHLVDNPKIVEASAAVRLLEVAAANPDLLNRIPGARELADREDCDPLELFSLVRIWIEKSPEPARRIRALTYFGEAGLLLLARPALGEDAPSRIYLETIACHCGGRVYRFELKTGHSREICEDCGFSVSSQIRPNGRRSK